MIFDLTTMKISSAINSQLVVIMPIYNERENIENVIAEWIKVFKKVTNSFTVIALNDGSRDNTMDCLIRMEKEFSYQLCVVNKTNSGHGLTCRMGYEIAVATNAEWVFQIDSDGQCDPRFFPEFWSRAQESDCVFGIRFSRDDGIARVFTSQICRLASSVICGADLRDPNVPYRLIRRTILRSVLPFIPTGFNIHNVALTFALKKIKGIRWSYVPIHFRDRQGGSNSLDFLRVAQWGIEMLLELARLRI